MDASRGLRQDLFQDAFAVRPLPKMRVDGRLTRRLPPRLRERTVWAPHIAVGLAGVVALLVALADNGGGDLHSS